MELSGMTPDDLMDTIDEGGFCYAHYQGGGIEGRYGDWRLRVEPAPGSFSFGAADERIVGALVVIFYWKDESEAFCEFQMSGDDLATMFLETDLGAEDVSVMIARQVLSDVIVDMGEDEAAAHPRVCLGRVARKLDLIASR